MRIAFGDVAQFHRLAGIPAESPHPAVPQVASADERAELARIAQTLMVLSEGLSKSPSVAALRVRLMLEELGEVVEAVVAGDVVAYADGLADLCYVTIGSAVHCSVPLPDVWAEVQRSNLEKFPKCPACFGDGICSGAEEPYRCPQCLGAGRVVVRDAGGKVMKPPSWTPPDVANVIRRAGGVLE